MWLLLVRIGQVAQFFVLQEMFLAGNFGGILMVGVTVSSRFGRWVLVCALVRMLPSVRGAR